MKLGVRVLCQPAVGAGFTLAGLPVATAESAEEAATILRGWLADDGPGVVVIEQRFHDQLPDEVRHRLSRRPLPMVVPFPGPERVERAEPADSYIVELLRQVIGYRVRVR